MALTTLDWTIVVLYFIVSAAIGLVLSSRGSRSVSDFFLSGRSLPWWLAGTSMVATTFAADTPLAVAGLVARNGISGNWIWWSAASGNMLTVFFFARLWRRAGILTDVEFAELRYGGRPAAVLRGFRLPKERAASIRIPTLVMAGDKTQRRLLDVVDTLAQAIPGATKVILKGQTHNVSGAALAGPVREFLKARVVPERPTLRAVS